MTPRRDEIRPTFVTSTMPCLALNLFIFGIVFTISATAAFAEVSQCTYRYSREAIQVNGHAVTVEYYIPSGRVNRGVVFMLHGSAGAFTNVAVGEPDRDNFGEKTIARNCFAVVLPHYFEALGMKSVTSKEEAVSLFPKLLEVCGTLLSASESSSWNKGRSVFLFGESLDGYLSVALTIRRAEIRAVSEIGGGLAPGYTPEKPQVFSLLISHGEHDNVVPIKEAEELKRYCTGHGISVELKVYAEAGHYFSYIDESNCILRRIEFFDR